MNRRSFIQSLLVGVVAPAFLPGANRQWKRVESVYVPWDEPLMVAAGNPEHEITGKTGDLFFDYASSIVYRKDSGKGNTGWVKL